MEVKSIFCRVHNATGKFVALSLIPLSKHQQTWQAHMGTDRGAENHFRFPEAPRFSTIATV